MTQKHLKEYLIESQRVDEMLMTMLAVGIIGLCAAPMLKSFLGPAKDGIKSFFGGLGSLFSSNDKDKDKDKDKDNKSKGGDDNSSNETSAFSSMLALAREHLTDDDDREVVDVLSAASVDENGNPVPLDEMGNRMRDLTGTEPDDLLRAYNIKPPEGDELKKIQDAAHAELKKMTPEERQKAADKQLEEARKASKAMQEHKEKQDKLEKELEEAKKGGDKEKIEAAQKALDDHKANATGPAKALAEAVTKAKEYQAAAAKEGKPEEEPGKNDKDDKPGKNDKDDKPEKNDKDDKPGKNDKDDKPGKKPEAGEDGEPAGTTAKEEVIKDPKTGEKKKQKIYTGPQGGRYYYPDKTPHKPENKVYVEGLRAHLTRTL